VADVVGRVEDLANGRDTMSTQPHQDAGPDDRERKWDAIEVFNWFVDGGHYLLPDGTPVRAVLVERDDDEWYWKIKDMEGQLLYTFWDDGRVYSCVRVSVPYSSGADDQGGSYTSIRPAPCDLTIADLRPATSSQQSPDWAPRERWADFVQKLTIALIGVVTTSDSLALDLCAGFC
jgi:hypothetical protein